MRIGIIGCGLSGLTLASRLQERADVDEIVVFEKEDKPGGLCRSFNANGVTFDVGPHILFSKNREALDFLLTPLGDNRHKLRRSNRIIYKGRLVQYPFENDLSKLPEKDCEYCLNAFLHNPYESYPASNMVQFFLKTFGEGITNCYLRPYNEKIWKFDPCYMDTQMVERIPKPPKEDIIASANGETRDGYLHQLYFWYPRHGGIESEIEGLARKLGGKVQIKCGQEAREVEKNGCKYFIRTKTGLEEKFDELYSTMPLNELAEIFRPRLPEEARASASKLRYNSIAITLVSVREDLSGDNFAFMTADGDVIFHRISKINFLGKKYASNGLANYLVEVTYREDTETGNLSDSDLLEKIGEGLHKIGFVRGETVERASLPLKFKYAYVIYDIEHKKNASCVKGALNEYGVRLAGRFGTWEYLNMDAVVSQAVQISRQAI